ncbi:hypothetical protein Sgly_0278 [Syntrophobotulus glycolicus DSM 8271]|uniref:Uncharacterized protein n=1 Tax=Syntrophobotulus glycolicus (strain DSM 8271 / FlGlyR) TaxID=645991 RepID=F0SWV7_SYNGF|nr:hypothetical protein [Syntrophobotulus glycolicus]ADY54647.1 hypothetical protein Sgly_0278 [Syntrophobotulus glycolicus DSM 8271]
MAVKTPARDGQVPRMPWMASERLAQKRTPRSLILPILLLSIVLLLYGCAEKDQTVSETEKERRSDSFDAGETGAGAAAGSSMDGSNVDAKNNDVKNSPEAQTIDTGNSGAEAASEAKAVEMKDKATEKNEVPPKNSSGQPVEIKFSEMYAGGSSRGLKFSDKLTGLNGKKVAITGYMAPPLKPSFAFFVLTRQPMSICPFCSTDASWPEDIILVFLPKGESRTPTDAILTVSGRLELGSHTDPDTGFVSQARIYSDKIKVVQ